MLLTIAIPTFNRREPLLETVKEILEQIESKNDVELLILDNHSCYEVEKELSSVIPCGLKNVRILSNRANIGLAANVIRCLEMAEGDWVWLLGDDDSIRPDAVERIIEKIDGAEPEVCLLLSIPKQP